MRNSFADGAVASSNTDLALLAGNISPGPDHVLGDPPVSLTIAPTLSFLPVFMLRKQQCHMKLSTKISQIDLIIFLSHSLSDLMVPSFTQVI